MKKYQLLAYAGAIALLSTGFIACSDDNLAKEEVTPSPGYNPETNEVTANFVFNVSTNTSNSTRMSSANTQASVAEDASEVFRGITDARLYAIKLKKLSGESQVLNDGQHLTDDAPEVTPTVKKFDLGTVMARNAIAPASTTGTLPQSRRVVELALPTETNTLVFYGRAIKDGGDDADKTQGKTEIVLSDNGNMNDIHFRLCKVLSEGSDAQTAFQQCQALITAALTKIINTSYTATGDVTVDGRKVAAETTIKWSDYVTISHTDATINSITVKSNDPVIAVGESSAQEMSNLGEILGQAYATFNTIYNNGDHSELRAGSGPAIKRMMSDLYTVIKTVADATAVNIEETVASRLASNILTNISSCFDPSESFVWKKNGLIKTFVGYTDAQVSKVELDRTMEYFPQDFNLPYGSTILEFKWNTTSGVNAPQYYYMGAVPTYAMGGESGTTSSFDPANYAYPPELCYFGNSPIRVTDNTKNVTDYPDGTANWINSSNTKWSDWTDNSHVLSTTRSVAMRDCINYGNALLKTTVGYATGTLKDNNHQIQFERTGANENDNSISVLASDGATGLFQLTGILIGGQNGSVGWNYIPRADAAIEESSAPQFKYMVYDGQVVDGTIPAASSASGGGTTAPTYTLLWDNYDVNLYGRDQRTVYVALEFVNNSGRDFWGMNNLIPNGGTFYITGKLDPDAITVADKTTTEIKDDKSLGISWPTTHEMAPYYTKAQATAAADPTLAGKTVKQRRVFMQDFVTEANFKLTQNSLKYALVAVPDLRSSQISLGLSVDLQWKQGLKYENVPLQGGQ